MFITHEERVKAGHEALSQRFGPGYWRNIDTRRLDLQHSDYCMVAQVAGRPYFRALWSGKLGIRGFIMGVAGPLSRRAYRLGFWPTSRIDAYRLRNAWVDFIRDLDRQDILDTHDRWVAELANQDERHRELVSV